MDENNELQVPQETVSVPEEPMNYPQDTRNIKDKAADAVKGAGQAVDNVGKTVKGASKVQDAAGKATSAAGKGTKAAGKAAEAGGKAVEAGGKALEAGGKGVKEGGQALGSALAAIPYVGGVLGAITKGTTAAAGTGMEVGGKGMQVGGKGMQAGGKGMQKGGDAADKAGKRVSDASKKTADVGKKISDTGDKIKDAGKKIDNIGPQRDSDANRSGLDKAKDMATKAGEKAAKKIKTTVKDMINPLSPGAIIRRILRGFFIIIFIIYLIYSFILGPIMAAMEAIKEVANVHEKFDNFMNGLGFGDSYQVFYDEMDYLNTHYDGQLDVPLIMATVFYEDMMSNGVSKQSSTEKSVEALADSDSIGGFVMNIIKDIVRESNETVGEDGLTYTSNKVYRMRMLARHQFNDKFSERTVSLGEYIDICAEQMSNELARTFKSLPTLLAPWNFANTIESLYQMISGDETFETTDWGASFTDNFITHAIETIKVLLSCFTDITDVDMSVSTTDEFPYLDIDIDVTYKIYQVDEDAYFDYLRDTYIRKMPEFKKYIESEPGVIDDKKVEGVIYTIKTIRDDYEKFFGAEDTSAEAELNCLGDVNPYLVDKLEPAVPLSIGQTITFSGSNNYGYYQNKKHNGVDLEASSTGTTEGNQVKSVYTGKVIASTADGTYNDTVKGGWLAIQYTVKYEVPGKNDDSPIKNVKSSFVVYYGGMSPGSVTKRKDDPVQKGEVIGTVGSAADSENGTAPSIHFGFYDLKKDRFINPVNVFITCNVMGGGAGACGNNDKEKLWSYLTSEGFSTNAAGAIMGNIEAESNFKSNNLENCYEEDKCCKVNGRDYGFCVHTEIRGFGSDEKYTAGVDSGAYTHFNTDRAGYGVVQWTDSSRKKGLYNYVVGQRKKSISDLNSQTAYIIEELNKNHNGLYNYLKGSNVDVYTATKRYMLEYEIPADRSEKAIQGRVDKANAIIQTYQNFKCNTTGNYNAEVGANGSAIIGERLDTFLEKNGSSLAELNSKITENVNSAGVKTRGAVVAAATTLINEVAKYGKKIPYTCGGGWGNRITGAQGDWGASHAKQCKTNCSKTKCYVQNGLDCSGFVRWALNTAGYSLPATGAASYQNVSGMRKVTLNSGSAVLRPGDLMASSGHVVLVVSVNENEKKYVVAESGGLEEGVQFRTMSFSPNGYYGLDCSSFYSE